MSERIRTITIYGASSSKVDASYVSATYELGKLLAMSGVNVITGGGGKGLMGAVADGVLENGGKVTGIIPRFMVEEGWLCEYLSETIVVEDMHARKALMAQQSDACIALPGGIGTMEELMEIITWKQLGLYNNPIIILNIGAYYDPLLSMLQKAISEKFMRQEVISAWSVASSPEEVLILITEQKQLQSNLRLIAAM